MKTLFTTLALAALAVLAAPADARDPAAGAAKAKEVCAACHGMDGNSPTPDYPKIGGQYEDYLAKALRDYKSGVRKNAIMAGFAGALTKQDIANLAAHYASQPRAVSARY
jgi:cytochrome c553